MHAPDIMGNVRLSSNDPRSNASATPATNPATIASRPSPNQPPVENPLQEGKKDDNVGIEGCDVMTPRSNVQEIS